MEPKMKKNVFAVIIFSLLIFLSTLQVVTASFLPPEPFEIWSPDGTYVFRWNPDPDEVHHAYAGLYRNGELIYFIANLPSTGITEFNFFLSQDFMHFIFLQTIGPVALDFYSYGQLVKTHYIADLVMDMERVQLTSVGYFWFRSFEDIRAAEGRRPAIEHVVEDDILQIITVDRIIYEFDLTTGEILSYYVVANPVPWLLYAIFVAAGLFAVVVVGVIVAKKRHMKP